MTIYDKGHRTAPPRILTSALAGDDGWTEDRVLVADDCVVVLDGVSSLRPAARRSGWYPEALGKAIIAVLTKRPGTPLRDAVAEAIAQVAASHHLISGQSPASTVAIARRTPTHLEGLVLGDSPIIVYGTDGWVDVFRDARHDAVVAELRRAELESNRRPPARNAAEVRALIRATRPAKLKRMNRDGGYWIAEATALAGHRALIRRWPLAQVAAALLVTDGVSCGVDDYAIPPSWPDALDLALHDGLDDLLHAIHEAEASDPDARRWPRGKRHDDKAAVLLLFPPLITTKGRRDG